MWATAMSPVADLFNQKVEGVAWRSKPSWYIVANNDHTVNPELERFAAERMGATTYDVDSSHVPMLSHPDARARRDPQRRQRGPRLRSRRGGVAADIEHRRWPAGRSTSCRPTGVPSAHGRSRQPARVLASVPRPSDRT